MTIQEYIRIAVAGTPKKEYDYYKRYFTHMDCEHCFYNGYACQTPKEDGVCMDYRVEKKDLEFKKTGSHEKNS